MYEYYQTWLKKNNPDSLPLQKRLFTKRFVKQMQQYRFEINKKTSKNEITYLMLENSIVTC